MTLHGCITTTDVDRFAEEMVRTWKLAWTGQHIAKEAEEDIERASAAYVSVR
jgi:hypothetical protein